MNKLQIAAQLLFKSGIPLPRRIGAWLRYRRRARDWAISQDWSVRVNDVLQCPDNARIPRISQAGSTDGEWIWMHNGLRIKEGGYYESDSASLFAANRGVHEPQEEFVFGEVLRTMPQAPVMLELGAYWGFYSMWLKSVRPDARCILLEADAHHLEVGQSNFAENGFVGEFVHARIGARESVADGHTTTTVDRLMEEKIIARLDILHADIQGHELRMLTGAKNSLKSSKIDYVFLSTHTNALHYRCRDVLVRSGYRIIADVDMLDTYSFDGLLAAQRSGLPPFDELRVSLRSRD